MNDLSIESTLPSSSSENTPQSTTPHSVLFVAIVIVLFIGLLALEVSDSFFLHDHQLARSLFVLPIPCTLLWGLLHRRLWAWWAIRIVALLAAILYTLPTIGVWFFFPHLQTGLRLWLTGVGIILFSLVLSVYLALSRASARAYFRRH
jgi:hypothetical protein